MTNDTTQEAPWLSGVRGEQVLPLINSDAHALRVAAGPGTGKTFGLRKHVLRLLHPDGLGVLSSRVLVCAFNRVIAADLRKEIEAELSPHGLESPEVQTVHGLAGRLAGETVRYLLPHELEAMMYDVLESNPTLDDLYEHKHNQALRALREHESGISDHSALGTAVSYWLTAHGAALVGGLPRSVETRLRNGDFGDHRYDHIIIDEFQDLTDVEAKLILGLLADGGHVVALGDRKQSIYAFRGNEGRGLDALPDLVATAVVDTPMDECQRCPSEIVLLANDVMAIYDEPLQVVRGTGGQVHQVHFDTSTDEHQGLAREIVDNFRQYPDSKHLVLVTRRQWGYDMRNAIRAVDDQINAQTVFSDDILETWPAREAFLFFSLLADPDDAATLRDWVAYRVPDDDGKKWKAPRRNTGAYTQARSAQGVLNMARAYAIADGGEADLSGAGRRNLHRRLQRLKALRDETPETDDLSEMVSSVLDPARWITETTAEPALAREDIERLRQESLRMLEDEHDGQEVTLKSLAQKLRYRISTREPLGQADEPDIKIVTLWGAKGLTADYVYIVGLCDEALPGPYDPHSTGLTEEEHRLEQLRLLYVSLTRAKRSLVISRPLRAQRGEIAVLGLARTANGYWQQLRHCRFFNDVAPAHLPTSVAAEHWPGISHIEDE